ncbi:PKD domain-containing protein [Conexibacter sp. SYSU D00693]|uniref:PKD domain-containing protein n=1 Tax=Conexibacter sp. SYSU D00693 TaxID=2812560 RepID=UPI00196A8ADC|nr:PKD domain-containing protein [Conexibacter sp. SYSU D00693]
MATSPSVRRPRARRAAACLALLGLGLVPGTAHAAATAGPLELRAQFVSSTGWVKPGQEYPFKVLVRNPSGTAVDGAKVTVEHPRGTAFTTATGPGGATVGEDGATVTWDPGELAAGATATLVVRAKARTLGQEPTLPWRDLSSTATLEVSGAKAVERTHGPKAIPPSSTYETARFGDRPFPVVPVEYQDRAAGASAQRLDQVINDPGTPGSTFNLYQEMSYGQLFPQADVPSAGIASKGFEYGPGFDFTRLQLGNTCLGVTLRGLQGGPLYQQRIRDGWYRLPGTLGYYGSDGAVSALLGAQLGLAALQQIDNGCGPNTKVVWDAAAISDPEIDFNDFDTDKDGLVDFFMVVFAGVGGNGDSQTQLPLPYDNVWPNSGTLENSYTDPRTGLKGFTTDDRLTDLEGRPLFYEDDAYARTTTRETPYPAYVRIGPYNLNPETAIEKASVISHEYGHSLGLPDYYSTGSRLTYGTWNLMAEDRSQHMSLAAKQQLGWVVPRVLDAGTTRDAAGMRDGKLDTHRIDWRTRDGKPYTLEGPDVHNGEAYAARLPGRQVLDPATVPSGKHVWWSTQGNDFGCSPVKGSTLDIAIPGLRDVPKGTKVTLRFKTAYEIEWDFDYGFVLASPDGRSWRSLPSARRRTTPASQNPNGATCQGQLGNGLTGTPQSFDGGSASVDRLLGEYPGGLRFVDDEYDLSSLAGTPGVVRFSYSTDTGAQKRGWFIDDLEVRAGDQVLYRADFETDDDAAVFPGACRDTLSTARSCTRAWTRIAADRAAPSDHAYYLELRDRSGFDADGHGQDDRGNGPTFQPGLLLEHLDEFRGDGNVGVDDPPAVSPLDARPEPGSSAPDLDDAAFTGAEGRRSFADSGEGHVDNYSDPSRPDGRWRFDFDCLSFDVRGMAGDGVGPTTAPGDLQADVALRAAKGCAQWDHGYGDVRDGAPVAKFSVSGGAARAGAPVTFDASASYDDLDALERLSFRWDLTGDGKTDARGLKVRRTFTRAARRKVSLTVVDRGGHRTKRTRRVTIGRAARLLTSIGRPRVAGGALRVRVRVGRRAARVALVVRRGGKVLRRTSAVQRRAGRRVELRLPTRSLPRGRRLRVEVVAVRGRTRQVVTRTATVRR